MKKPWSRKRVTRTRRRRAVATALGRCCLAAAGAAVASTAAAALPPRRAEKRPRLQREYYRRLASRQQPPEHLGEADTAAAFPRDGGEGRRLPADVHKKGRDYGQKVQAAVHKKGNRDEDEDESLDFVVLGSGGGSSQSASSAPARPKTNNSSNKNEDDPDPDPYPRRATNLRSFTRIGGRGYSLPPEKRYPYMASLQLEGHTGDSGDVPFDVHMCGGFLVAPDMVLTAAHCARYSPPGTDESFRAFNGVELGKVDLRDEGAPFDPLSLETYKLYYENLVPDELLIHPDYDEATYRHDVMLVKVFGKSRFPPVRVADRAPDFDVATILGWGAASATDEQKYSDRLHSAQMDLMGRNQCRDIEVRVRDPYTERISVLDLRDHVHDDMMCASSRDRYMCYGDAGGPAIYRGGDSDGDEAYGILSWGYGCVDPAYPAVMARISDHYNWIRNKVCERSSAPPEWFDCPGRITALAGGSTQTVTLKLKLDMMSVETGFVVEASDTREVLAQRVPGYYKSEENEIVLETMDLPRNQCYRLRMLDSYGDGNCCDMGGGPARLYKGTDVGYYSGELLAEVDGMFEFDSSAEFCLDRRDQPVNTVQVVGGGDGQEGPTNNNGNNGSNNGNDRPTNNNGNNGSNNGNNGSNGGGNGGNNGGNNGSNNGNNGGNGGNNGGGDHWNDPDGSSGWSGPVSNPAFEYCIHFCQPGRVGSICGNYECIHVATSDSDEDGAGGRGDGSGGRGSGGRDEDREDEEGGEDEKDNEEDEGADAKPPTARPTARPTPEPTPEPTAVSPLEVSNEFYDPDSEYFLTVRFQFDDNPEDISWVLYDLTANEVKVFVDFDAYEKATYANEVLDVKVTMLGPDEGEKQYAFTVYDRASNGLCCAHGRGYYKVYLGDAADEEELLGDDEFDFSSSYYFTLFEDEMIQNGATLETDPPTEVPTEKPTRKPTPRPTREPTREPTPEPTPRPTERPTERPTTARPTYPWEKRRDEDVNAIGARWSMRTNTPPGVFNDVGGDQGQYKIRESDWLRSAATHRQGLFVVGGMALFCSIVLGL